MLNGSEPANSIDYKAAVKICQRVSGYDREESEALFREIQKETGIITEERPRQTCRFIHLTFCEYLGALEAVEGQVNGFKKLVSTHRSNQRTYSSPQMAARLTEVIPFACGLLSRVAREPAISQVADINDAGLLARCFLETKLYDHQYWPSFVEKRYLELSSTPEHQWDDAWLRDLHLFNVVLKDAENCNIHVRGADQVATTDDLIKNLVGTQPESLGKLLSSYAAQDAAAAFRVAEISGIDLATVYPSLVVTHCDQVPFLALALQQASLNERKLQTWAPLITEAALRSRAVISQLNKSDLPNTLKVVANQFDSKKRWFNTPFVKETPYSELMTIAANSRFTQVPDLVFLRLVSTGKPPGALSFVCFLPYIVSSWMLVVTGAYMLAIQKYGLKIPEFMLAIAIYASLPFTLTSIAYRKAYYFLLNLHYIGKSQHHLLLRILVPNVPAWLYTRLIPKELRIIVEKVESLQQHGRVTNQLDSKEHEIVEMRANSLDPSAL